MSLADVPAMVALELLTRLRNVSPRAAPVTAVPVTVVPATPTLLRIVALTVRTFAPSTAFAVQV